jgi:pilus assembly protein CpaF
VPRPSAPPRFAPAGARGVTLEPLDPQLRKMLELQAEIHGRLAAKLDLADIPTEQFGDEELWQRAESGIVDLVETLESSGEIPDYINQDTLIKESLNEVLGLGPLEDLLADDEVDEILIDRSDRIIVGKRGRLRGSGRSFSSDAAFRRVVERLVAPTGHTVDEQSPLLDVRLRDGSRLAVAVPPVAVRGACLTLQKPRRQAHSLADLIAAGTLSPAMGDFLSTCIGARQNVLVCGAPGSGRSAILSALAVAAPESERIVSVEEVAELAVGRDNWIALEARPGDQNGVVDVNLLALLHSALRMRPDRLVVGDVRGVEAFDLLQAMASSTDGSLASITGEGASVALARLACKARLAAPEVGVQGIRELCAAAVQVVVHVARYADGVYRIAQIVEVGGATEAGFDVRELFRFQGSGAEGGFAAAGVVPAFYAALEARGIPADTSIFR